MPPAGSFSSAASSLTVVCGGVFSRSTVRYLPPVAVNFWTTVQTLPLWMVIEWLWEAARGRPVGSVTSLALASSVLMTGGTAEQSGAFASGTLTFGRPGFADGTAVGAEFAEGWPA